MKFIDLIKLLPLSQRDKPSESFVKGFQAELEEFNDEKVSLLKNSFRLDLMNQENIENYIHKLGYTLTSGDGFTSDLQYFQREMRTIVDRLTSKCADFSYENIYYIYNFSGTTYPLIVNDTTDQVIFLEPWLDWLEFTGVDTESQDILDSGYLDDGTNPVSPVDPAGELDSEVDNVGSPISGQLPTYLDDAFSSLGVSTRHFLLSYYPFEMVSTGKILCENTTEFTSIATLNSFNNNVEQFKRLVEVPHYEHHLRVTVSSGVDYTTECVDINGISYSPAVVVYSRLFTGMDLANVTKIQFGTGAHTNGDITGEVLTGCATPLDISTTTGLTVDGSFRTSTVDWNVVDLATSVFKARNYPTVTMKFPAFTEVCLLDSSNNVVAYAKFPRVQFHQNMLSSVCVEFTKV